MNTAVAPTKLWTVYQIDTTEMGGNPRAMNNRGAVANVDNPADRLRPREGRPL